MMYLYHYFEKSRGPFLSISELPYDEGIKTLTDIQKINPNLVNPNKEWFINRRYEMEAIVREKFISKGGRPKRKAPFYMTLGEDNGMLTWYDEPEVIKIDVSEFDKYTISFTYGDMFPIFNPALDDGKEYRNNVYLYDEILKIIDRYGFPEKIEYSIRDSIYPKNAPINFFLKYVETQIWSSEIPQKYRNQWLKKRA